MPNPMPPPARLSMIQVLLCGAAVVTLSMGIRHGFGLFLQPITMERGWPRETFAFAMAVQNLAWGLAGPVISLFNVFGTYGADALGQRMAKSHILSAIYALRGVVIVAFVLAPLTPWSVYLFAAAMGLLWLSTVPPTNAIVAQIFGVQYMSMLGGFVFLSHQLGSFMGVWLGGRLHDMTGSYTIVWWLSVALSVMAALANLPVREAAIVRPLARAT